jgi:hypothetical protein
VAEGNARVAWADKPYTVQVKSGEEKWVFKNQESVAWFLRHPLPFFLCRVDKSRLRFRVFQTTPKYYLWTNCQQYPDGLELRPDLTGTVGQTAYWHPEQVVYLSAPILDFTLDQLADREFFQRVRRSLTLGSTLSTRTYFGKPPG